MGNEKKSWADLTPTEKRAVYIAGAVEVALTTAAIVDLAKRPSADVRGRKWAWLVSFIVQPFGPLAYFACGRRSHSYDGPE